MTEHAEAPKTEVSEPLPESLYAHEVLALGVIFHLAQRMYPLRPIFEADTLDLLFADISRALEATLPDVELMDLQPFTLNGLFHQANERGRHV